MAQPGGALDMMNMSWTRLTLKRLLQFTVVYIPVYNYLNWRDFNPVGPIKSKWAMDPQSVITPEVRQRGWLFPTEFHEDKRKKKQERCIRKNAHVIVIGGGVAGLTSAYYLNQRGYRVSIVEKQDTVGLRNSFGFSQPFEGTFKSHLDKTERELLWNAVMGKREDTDIRTDAFRIHEEVAKNKWDKLWLLRYMLRSIFREQTELDRKAERLRMFSRNQLDLMADETNLLEKVGFESQDTIHVYANNIEADEMEGEEITKRAAIRQEPLLKNLPEGKYKFSCKKNVQVASCFRFCRFLADYLEKHGVRFYFHSTAGTFERDQTGIVAVQTDQGRLICDAVVVCTGVDSMDFARQWGILQPMKRYAYIFDGAQDVQVNNGIRLHPSECDVRQVASTTAVTWMSELDKQVNTVRKRRLDEFKDFMWQYFPTFDINKAHLWIGADTVTPDSLPIISRGHYDNLFYNMGHGRNNMVLACGSGRLVADLVQSVDSDIDQMPYDIRRFWWWRPLKMRDPMLNEVGKGTVQRLLSHYTKA